MTLAQQWRCLNLIETAFTSYFLRKISSVIGKSFLAVSAFVKKGLVHSLAELFQTQVNKPNKVNVNRLKISKKYRGRTKRRRGPRV